jgi:medium-chain acyl-[acyl-carrier-protein] hydrolase
MVATPMPHHSPWFSLYPNPQAHVRLFCFPYAGGGTIGYRQWSAHLLNLELILVQLPGRERRLSESAFTDLNTLVETIAIEIQPYCDRPFAFFGHSMGGLTAFELTRSLRRHHQPQPLHLLISGCRAPHLPPIHPPLHTLSDTDFIQELRRYNGTPEAVLTNAELMQLFLPTLRADFTAIETYRHAAEPFLDRPITVFGGLQDAEVNPEDLGAWQMHTTSNFTQHMLPGDHFFLHSSQALLLQHLQKEITGSHRLDRPTSNPHQ